ncbi:hypothetical protein L211DRAFT_841251 [Terfezia boudieri ATCC MYA-4762]|uniref:Tc1-like transposase DDE domain-containing protein n=1 Tax=Terfezia boudieri ATCC MYA-4762 TaxID=1051890 RepID=A0A3N4LDH4_9PEZI|nr:hypothetical protein L211DRAFT_841251 [Terfezia boudieri ATCC MYA-4762]
MSSVAVSLPLVKEDMAAAGISTPVFMQDNSPIHNSYYSLGWLQDEGWKVADHPANFVLKISGHCNLSGRASNCQENVGRCADTFAGVLYILLYGYGYNCWLS